MAGRRVSWYLCGPTVYSDTHLGHARNYVCSDMIRRALRQHFGYQVHYVMNITNIDDKIIKNAVLAGTPFEAFAARWEQEFYRDMKALGNDLPDAVLRVSEFMPEIVAYIRDLIEGGMAYESNQSVYFNVPEYSKSYPTGVLKVNPTEVTEEDEDANPDKRDQRDFALWKRTKEGEPFWESPWGSGRPGWHI